jgi:hypothetical protein
MTRRFVHLLAVLMLLDVCASARAQQTAQRRAPGFDVEEATIERIQQAILKKQITTQGVVEAYLRRIHAYNGTCVNEPQGILGPVTTMPHAGQINALSTLNLRPRTRAAWGFDARKARSMTDMVDEARNMPDALEMAATQDQQFAKTGRLVGPLHGVVLAIKDQYDTFDMRTTSGADADYANDCGTRAPSSWRRPISPSTPLTALAARLAGPSAIRTTPSVSQGCRAPARPLRSPPTSLLAPSARRPSSRFGGRQP